MKKSSFTNVLFTFNIRKLYHDVSLLFPWKEFITLAKELKKSPQLRNYITTNAKKYIGEHHPVEKETKTYKWLVKKLISLQRQQSGSTFEESREILTEQVCWRMCTMLLKESRTGKCGEGLLSNTWSRSVGNGLDWRVIIAAAGSGYKISPSQRPHWMMCKRLNITWRKSVFRYQAKTFYPRSLNW